MRRMSPLLGLVVILLLLPACARADGPAPVLPGEYADPTVTQFGGQYVASATSNRWAPALPVLVSSNLVSWRLVANVFPTPPAWVAGKRFWAPELTVVAGRLLLLYSGLKHSGQWCIGAATAAAAEGPWVDSGPVLCPPDGGGIDPALVTTPEGESYLLYKSKGAHGPIQAVGFDPISMQVAVEAPTTLVRPMREDGRVTEGPAIVSRGGRWYLFFATGSCCRPPCDYVERVARADSVLGPYERLGSPILSANRNLGCPGHGTPVPATPATAGGLGPVGELPRAAPAPRGLGDLLPAPAPTTDGSSFDTDDLLLLHHAYPTDNAQPRRREGVLTRLRFGRDGWPRPVAAPGIWGPAGTDPPQPAPRDPAPPRDDLSGSSLSPAWQWSMRFATPVVAVGSGRLRMACAGGSVLTRQLAGASSQITAILAPGRARMMLATRDAHGLMRGVEFRRGSVRPIRRVQSQVISGGRPVKLSKRVRRLRARITVRPGGNLRIDIRARGRWRQIRSGPAAHGRPPVRLAVGCFGSGNARLGSLRGRSR